jgi:hypothetical protein
VPQRARADRGGLGEHAQPAERLGHRDEVLRRHHGELGGEAVQPRDAVLGVVAGVAGVGGARGARAAVAAGPAHGRGDEVAAREAQTALLDPAQQLVAQDQAVVAGRGDAEPALGDLAIGTADADLERPHQHLRALGARHGHLHHRGGVRRARAGHERLHQPGSAIAGRDGADACSTAPSAAEPTDSR